jgi:uncharacterized metal-binding protein YceD (DUF177 family)
MANRLNPIHISLKDLPAEGREFTYSNETGELNKVLAPLIGKNPYSIHIKLMPMGNSVDLKGEVETSMDLQCSLCAMEYSHPIKLSLHELIVVQKALAKGDQQTRTNHAHEWEASGPDYIILESGNFEIDHYIHEMVALAEPIRPLGRPNCDQNCENLAEKVKRDWLSYGENQENDGIKANPFKVLEKMKFKS